MYTVFLPDVSDTAKHLEQLFNHVMVSCIHRKILLRGREGEREERKEEGKRKEKRGREGGEVGEEEGEEGKERAREG